MDALVISVPIKHTSCEACSAATLESVSADLEQLGGRWPITVASAVHSNDKTTMWIEQFEGEHALNLRLDEIQYRLVAGAPARQVVARLAFVQQRHGEIDGHVCSENKQDIYS